ncbi:MAG: hypothetical protein PQJ59_14640 [Spirochaetales bacterium]|nr:hypothetical protein [Spirochaetales bacterium]
MKDKSFFNPARIAMVIIFFLICSPYFFWLGTEENPPRYVVAEAEEEEEVRYRQILWPFLFRKGEVLEEGRGDISLLNGSLSSDYSDREALLGVDKVKKTALSGRTFLCDGYSLTERSHSLFRHRLEDFLHVKNTGWVIRYERDEGARLIYAHPDEGELVLEWGTHFSGLPPTALYEGQEAPVYTWIPIYEVGDEAVVTAIIDAGLTKEGEELLLQRGIPREIPLIIESKSSLVNTGFFTVNIRPGTVHLGPYKNAWRLFFKSRLAFFTDDTNDGLYWRIYLPWMDRKIQSREAWESMPEPSPGHFVIKGQKFYLVHHEGEAEPFFIKGVNLGPALPGTWFTQFPEDEHLYYRWFGQMKEMNFNTVRIYTLFPPAFYRAFREFNLDHSDDPLYLLPEIWPEEHPENHDYLGEEYNRTYQEEIRLTVDALHGNRVVEVREGRAWGVYEADISPWILGWLIGREMEPEEVIETNHLNEGYVYRGRFISAPEGPPTEAWLAESCDLAVSYETDRYGSSRPAAMVSWPILDALHHEVEWNDPLLEGREPLNDKVTVDINRFTVEDDSFGGFFGAYHIYPNYPDFMNNQASYGEYKDSQGTFRYGGYLRDFMEIHSPYPALVAEYGISTSAATAHISPDGYHHGGLTEEEQAEGIIRMTDAIKREGYAGAIIFEWIDEWAKKTWTTEPFMIPYDRQALWHNVLDPEQNYGIMAMKGTSRRGWMKKEGTEGLVSEVWGDESHLYLHLERNFPWEEGDRIYFALDTYSREEGIFSFPVGGGTFLPSGAECLVEVNPLAGKARILTAEDYNISSLSLDSSSREGQEFRPIEILVNRAYRTEEGVPMAAYYTDWSELHSGILDEAAHSLSTETSELTLRLPWGLLNVSDPSSGLVLDDSGTYHSYPERDVIGVSESESILIYGLHLNNGTSLLLPDLIYRWETWDEPLWTQEEKKSIEELRTYFAG